MFFIMAYGFGKNPIPIVEGDDEGEWDDTVSVFDTEEEAEECAREQPLCQATGYEIFEMIY